MATITPVHAPEARVLVVDEEPDIRSTLTRFLGLLGYDSREASSGEQALEMLDSDPFDVAVVDIRLPGIDGLQVMQHASELRPETAVILLTGFPSVDSAIAAVKGQAVEYLQKPASIHDLASAIAGALARPRRVRKQDGRHRKRVLHAGSLTLDRARRRVVVTDHSGTHSANLTGSEMALLAYLTQRPGVVVSHSELACVAVACDVDHFEAPTLTRPHICRLRKKVEPRSTPPRIIRTVSGRGYLLAAQPHARRRGPGVAAVLEGHRPQGKTAPRWTWDLESEPPPYPCCLLPGPSRLGHDRHSEPDRPFAAPRCRLVRCAGRWSVVIDRCKVSAPHRCRRRPAIEH